MVKLDHIENRANSEGPDDVAKLKKKTCSVKAMSQRKKRLESKQ